MRFRLSFRQKQKSTIFRTLFAIMLASGVPVSRLDDIITSVFVEYAKKWRVTG